MQIFLDTANIQEIAELVSTGLVDGVTTNPSLVANSGQKFESLLEEICEMVSGPVSAEVISTDAPKMVTEGKKLHKIASNIVVKLPLTWDGLKACRSLSEDGIAVNVTLCFSANQALLAAKAGARYVSPFVGRQDDISNNGLNLIEDIVTIYYNYDFDTEVIVASARHPIHVLESAKMGADIVTLPPKLLKQLIKHPLTDIGLEKFLLDWEKASKDVE